MDDGPVPRLMTPGAIRAAFVMSQVVQFLSPFAFFWFGNQPPLDPNFHTSLMNLNVFDSSDSGFESLFFTLFAV
jgi:hypothetical protein